MPRPVICPHCREELDIPPELRRREVRCAVCRNTFVPDVDGREAPDEFAARTRPRDEFDDEPRPRRRAGSNRTAWVVVLGMFTCCGLGCGGFCVWAVVLQFPDFQPFESKEGRFHAEFPGEPKEAAVNDGRGGVEFSHERAIPKERFFVRYADLDVKGNVDDQKAARLLKDAADRAVRQVGGSKELSRASSTVGGYDAIDLLIQHPNRTHTVVRLILAKKRLYAVGVTGPNSLAFETPYVSRFLGGFRILPEPQPVAPAPKQQRRRPLPDPDPA